MEKKLILHIGYPRTATTWFQKVFFPNVENFKYLTNSHNIVLGKEKLTNFPQNLIISKEEIVNIKGRRSNPQKIKKNYYYILEKYDQIKIFVTIRKQTELIQSEFSFCAKSGWYYSFNNYFHKIKETGSINQWKYYTHLQFFENFPNSKMYIYLFEDFINNPLQTIEKLTKDLELDIDLSKINFKKKNQSPPSYILPLIINMSRINPFYGKVIFKLSHKLPGKRFKLPEKYIPEIKNMFAEENRLLDEKYNLGMKKYGYY